MQIVFEPRRLYVAPRKSVLFFARVNDEKIRCYVHEDALVEPARGLREEADLVQRCLLAFDAHRTAIESAAERLLTGGRIDEDGAVTISKAVLALEAAPPIAALSRPVGAQRRAQGKRSTPSHRVAEPGRRRVRTVRRRAMVGGRLLG